MSTDDNDAIPPPDPAVVARYVNNQALISKIRADQIVELGKGIDQLLDHKDAAIRQRTRAHFLHLVAQGPDVFAKQIYDAAVRTKNAKIEDALGFLSQVSFIRDFAEDMALDAMKKAKADSPAAIKPAMQTAYDKAFNTAFYVDQYGDVKLDEKKKLPQVSSRGPTGTFEPFTDANQVKWEVAGIVARLNDSNPANRVRNRLSLYDTMNMTDAQLKARVVLLHKEIEKKAGTQIEAGRKDLHQAIDGAYSGAMTWAQEHLPASLTSALKNDSTGLPGRLKDSADRLLNDFSAEAKKNRLLQAGMHGDLAQTILENGRRKMFDAPVTDAGKAANGGKDLPRQTTLTPFNSPYIEKTSFAGLEGQRDAAGVLDYDKLNERIVQSILTGQTVRDIKEPAKADPKSYSYQQLALLAGHALADGMKSPTAAAALKSTVNAIGNYLEDKPAIGTSAEPAPSITTSLANRALNNLPAGMVAGIQRYTKPVADKIHQYTDPVTSTVGNVISSAAGMASDKLNKFGGQVADTVKAGLAERMDPGGKYRQQLAAFEEKYPGVREKLPMIEKAVRNGYNPVHFHRDYLTKLHELGIDVKRQAELPLTKVDPKAGLDSNLWMFTKGGLQDRLQEVAKLEGLKLPDEKTAPVVVAQKNHLRAPTTVASHPATPPSATTRPLPPVAATEPPARVAQPTKPAVPRATESGVRQILPGGQPAATKPGVVPIPNTVAASETTATPLESKLRKKILIQTQDNPLENHKKADNATPQKTPHLVQEKSRYDPHGDTVREYHIPHSSMTIIRKLGNGMLANGKLAKMLIDNPTALRGNSEFMQAMIFATKQSGHKDAADTTRMVIRSLQELNRRFGDGHKVTLGDIAAGKEAPNAAQTSKTQKRPPHYATTEASY